jgi:hypothetical protein
MTDSSQRRRFQFSLRTLLTGVTLFCVLAGSYVGWQAKIVRARKSELNRVAKTYLIGIEESDQATTIPWLRRLLGDVTVDFIAVPAGTPRNEIDRLRALFPESSVTAGGGVDSPQVR